MPLKDYWKKRNFTKTTEPKGKVQKQSDSGLYVIQKHAASHLHYDLRLEIDGVLKSWAVPKGPCLDPKIKRLAVNVEDHPIEYGSFEGVIPKNEYGGGTVMLWDVGTWTMMEDQPSASKAYKEQSIKFYLYGQKLTGAWTLVKIKKSSKEWLLIKKQDDAVKAIDKCDILKQDHSVVSNRSMDQIASESTKVWTSNRKNKNTKKQAIDQVTSAVKKNQSKIIKPQLATLVKQAPSGNEWLHEIKYDGYRILTKIFTANKNTQLQLLTRNSLDWTKKFPVISKELNKLDFSDVIFDGEIVALDEQGNVKFQLLQNELDPKKVSKKIQLVYYVFDLIYYNGYDLSKVPLIQRKELLQQILPKNDNIIKYADHIIGNGPYLFEQACQLNLEGIISKKVNSLYYQKRTKEWVKTKCIAKKDFFIAGFTKPQGAREYFGALLIGCYEGKKLVYSGRVGTGFNTDLLEKLSKLMKPLQTIDCPFDKLPPQSKNATWIKPEIEIEVDYREFTADKVLRHASFKALKEDRITLSKSKASKNQKSLLTHPDKILYPEANITKQMLADYYTAIADYILPYIINRPLSLLRCTNNWNDGCFFQKKYTDSLPDGLLPILIPGKDKKTEYIYLKDLTGLLGLVQMGVLEIHPWGSQVKDVTQPDMMIFDLDPDPTVNWSKVVDAAFLLKDYLKKLNLQSFVKTTGGKGLHIVVPLKKLYSWPEVNNFAHSFSSALTAKYPNDFIDTMSKVKRKNKIFIDYLRNGQGSTAVAAYSTRARANASVSVPISWDELMNKLDPQQFDVLTVPTRLKKLKQDPWLEFFKLKQKLPKF